MWEPVWYFVPGVKAPKNNLLPARWLGFANSSGDDMTYYIWTENDPRRTKKGTKQARHRVLIRSVIRIRRKNIGQDDEYVTNNSAYTNCFLSPSEVSLNNDEGTNTDDGTIDDCSPSTTQSGEVMTTSENSTTPNEDTGGWYHYWGDRCS